MEEIEPLLKERPPPSSSKLPQHQVKSTSRARVGPHLPFVSPIRISHSHLLPTRPPRLSLHGQYCVPILPNLLERSERTRMMHRRAVSVLKMWKSGRCYHRTWSHCLSPLTYHLEKNMNLSTISSISACRRSRGEHLRQNSRSSVVASSSSPTTSSPIPFHHDAQCKPPFKL